jgi:hypothetical protein
MELIPTKTQPIDTNLKTMAALGKPTSAVIPPVAIMALGAAMQDGATKYGAFNWRGTGVTASVFFNAKMRHTLSWWSGEDFAQDSLIHHLAHDMASNAILLDAMLVGRFNDDRPPYELEGVATLEKLQGIYRGTASTKGHSA